MGSMWPDIHVRPTDLLVERQFVMLLLLNLLQSPLLPQHGRLLSGLEREGARLLRALSGGVVCLLSLLQGRAKQQVVGALAC